MNNKRQEIIFVPFIQKSFNDMFGVIKNPKLKPTTKLNMIKAIMGTQAQFAEAVQKYLNALSIEPFELSDKNKRIKLSFVPFYGQEQGKTKTGRKSPDRNPFDCVNYAPTIKVIEDKLVALGILSEDNYKIISTHETLPAIINRNYKGHGLFVIIEEIDDFETNMTDEFAELLDPVIK